MIINWLDKHDLSFSDNMTQAELFQFALANRPPKRYVVDEVAAKLNVQILLYIYDMQMIKLHAYPFPGYQSSTVYLIQSNWRGLVSKTSYGKTTPIFDSVTCVI